jgi:hypothetical protein
VENTFGQHRQRPPPIQALTKPVLGQSGGLLVFQGFLEGRGASGTAILVLGSCKKPGIPWKNRIPTSEPRLICLFFDGFESFDSASYAS